MTPFELGQADSLTPAIDELGSLNPCLPLQRQSRRDETFTSRRAFLVSLIPLLKASDAWIELSSAPCSPASPYGWKLRIENEKLC